MRILILYRDGQNTFDQNVILSLLATAIPNAKTSKGSYWSSDDHKDNWDNVKYILRHRHTDDKDENVVVQFNGTDISEELSRMFHLVIRTDENENPVLLDPDLNKCTLLA